MHPWINTSPVTRYRARQSETTQLSIRYGVEHRRLADPAHDAQPENPLCLQARPITGNGCRSKRLRIASPSFAQVNTPQAELSRNACQASGLMLSGSMSCWSTHTPVWALSQYCSPIPLGVSSQLKSRPRRLNDAVREHVEGIDNLEFVCSRTEDYLDSLH